MSNESLGTRRAALVAFLSFILFFSFAGSKEFWKRPEGRVATVAREMVASGNYLVPTIGGQPRFEKPPMMYWAVAGSARLFNGGRVNEWTAALPSALAGALTCMMTAMMATRFWGRATGLTAAAMLATSFGFYWWSHIGEMEMLFTAGITLSVGCFVLWDHRPHHLWLLFGAYAFAAVACLTKGPVALVIILAGTIANGIACHLSGRPVEHFQTRWHAAGLAVFFAIALPWPAMVLAHGEAKGVFTHEVLGRLSGEWQRHAAGPLEYFRVLPWLFVPWFVAIPLVFWRFGRRWGTLRKEHAPALFLAWWFLAVFTFFSLVRTKQDHYLLPALPASAMLTAWAFASLRKTERWVQGAVGIVAVGLLVYSGYFVPQTNVRRSFRQFGEEVQRAVGTQRDGLAFFFTYGESPTADCRADLFYYLGPNVHMAAVARRNGAAASEDPRSFRYLVVSEKDKTAPTAYRDYFATLRPVLTRDVDRDKFFLLTKSAP